ncbi:hypothetical protein K443DRAFT_440684 [Laccaria amethystina LaAM-08-1]|uniref:Unplaced genomic scaffold K443scaffold_389, whole genome shotgun sequence n=1 Tax=Laccaria amethystina LaAM-08-1 TaxID=1095629 RepID=A0A0C9WI35_9AGAR|nr:hypothetical protein K443DRAFT_440684 [Laccaria amethystina LaAM-08-1]
MLCLSGRFWRLTSGWEGLFPVVLRPNSQLLPALGCVSVHARCLQASRVRCAILDQLRRGRKEGLRGSVKLEKDLCFAFPSVDRMAGLCHFG